jgi:hypothetical protein
MKSGNMASAGSIVIREKNSGRPAPIGNALIIGDIYSIPANMVFLSSFYQIDI